MQYGLLLGRGRLVWVVVLAPDLWYGYVEVSGIRFYRLR